MHQTKSSTGRRLSRLVLATVGALALCALGAAPTQSCGAIPGGGAPVCGDGRVTGMEQCDGAVPAGHTCATEGVYSGYVSGTLRCDAIACAFDTRGCTLPVCGNGRIEGLEQCDGADVRGETCFADQAGTVTCDPELCIFDRTACKPPTCGNGVKEMGESCDGTDFDGHTCQAAYSDPAATGPLKCYSNCDVDLRECYPRPGFCGNGSTETPHEECDGDTTCQQYAVRRGLPADYYTSGRVACPDCSVTSTIQCTQNRAHCGNGILEREYGETCDGSDLGGATCSSAGFLFGSLRCSETCQLSYLSTCWGGCIPNGRGTYCQ